MNDYKELISDILRKYFVLDRWMYHLWTVLEFARKKSVDVWQDHTWLRMWGNYRSEKENKYMKIERLYLKTKNPMIKYTEEQNEELYLFIKKVEWKE